MYALYLESHFPENDYMYVYDWNGVSMQLSVHIRVLYQMCTCTVHVLHSSEFIEQSSLHIQSTYSTSTAPCVCVPAAWWHSEGVCTVSPRAATDNHVGYLEKDQVRGGDSLEAFEEVLRIAQEQQASISCIMTVCVYTCITA